MAMISMTEELRRRAVQIRSDAEQIDEPNVRAKMLEIAAEFDLLAEHANHLIEAQGAMEARYWSISSLQSKMLSQPRNLLSGAF